jgi:CheY-like chemotaxis protein
MHDPRKPRPLNPRTLSVLVADAHSFSRELIVEILRHLTVANIPSVRSADTAFSTLNEVPADLVLLSWDRTDPFDALAFARDLRQLEDNRLRRLPILLLTGKLTKQQVIAGRDAGIDEFLTKPISPVALRQRLEMVIETPRPFIDSAIFLGPCRRRKNPADYYGAKRRLLDRPIHIDQDEVARRSPIRQLLAQIRETCTGLLPGHSPQLAGALDQLRMAKELAATENDQALKAGLASFESYLGIAAPLGQIEEPVISAALSALEQLAALPPAFSDARDTVSLALGQIIQQKNAA